MTIQKTFLRLSTGLALVKKLFANLVVISLKKPADRLENTLAFGDTFDDIKSKLYAWIPR